MTTTETTVQIPDTPATHPVGATRPAERAHAAPPVVDVVIPVFNEAPELERSVRRVHDYLNGDAFPFTSRITIADNASTDGTGAIAAALAIELPAVRVVRLEQKGRGRALRAVWSASDAPVLAYMDVDLSTDLAALLPLVAPLVSGHSDLAIGSRLARSARVARGPKREIVSRCYNRLLHAMLATRFTDAQCGFKAIRADRARALLPLVQDTGWFFDTELLVLAERAGLRIHEVPVDWIDDPDSRVDIVATAIADLRGVARMVRGLASGAIPVAELAERFRPATAPLDPGRDGHPGAPGFVTEVLRFAAVGVASTLAYLMLFVALGTWMPTQVANATALLLTAIGNTAANRRYTFAVRGRRSLARHQVQGLAVFAAALLVTAGSLWVLHAAVPDASRALQIAVLVAANLVATALRFVLFRSWVFGPNTATVPAGATTPIDWRHTQ